MKAPKCKPLAQFAYNYSINVLSKCSNIISHRSRSSKVDTSITDLRRSTHPSSKVDTSIFEGRHIDLRGLTHRSSIFEGRHINHRSSRVDTSIIDPRRSTHRSSIFKGQHIDLRKSTHRSPKVDNQSSKVDPSIFEDRRRKHRTDNPTSHRQLVTEYRPQRYSTIFKYTLRFRMVYQTPIRIYTAGNSNTACDPTRAPVMY